MKLILQFPPLLALLAAVLDLSVTATPVLPSGCVTSSCIRSIERLKIACWLCKFKQTLLICILGGVATEDLS